MKSEQEKKWAYFRIQNDLRVNDFYDAMRAGGITLGNAKAKALLTGKVDSVVNKYGETYYFDHLLRAARKGLEDRKAKIETAEVKPKRGYRICALKPTGIECRAGILPKENIKPIVDAILKGNVRFYTVIKNDIVILYCGEPI